MTPIKVENAAAGIASQYYVAIPGEVFSIKISLARPGEIGATYGARVYVDQGGASNRYAYDLADSNGRQVELELMQRGQARTVDAAEFDHFFWIAAGETEYTISGFFGSSTTSREFIFARPPLTDTTALEAKPILKEARLDAIQDSIGCIRVQFSSVKEMSKRETVKIKPTPVQRATDSEGILDRKGCTISTAPGNELPDDAPGAAGGLEAVLEDEVIFECRLHYNEFSGYRAGLKQQETCIWSHVETYPGVPLSVLLQTDMRITCIDAHLRAVQRKRFADIECERMG